ncbi:MAG: hypothetical protein PHU23_14475 [Dehalococcoidales bacterium]|jgi:hypothetical protein|nr:hypothetical protein [Dehalococcoidales bacterium]
MINFKCIWQPLIGVGPFLFKTDISLYSDYKLIPIEEEYDDGTNWIGYDTKLKDIRIYTEENKIAGIACYDEFLYKNVNFIGLSINRICKILEIQKLPKCDIIELVDGTQFVYDFDEFNLQIWAKKSIIVSCMCQSDD